MIAWLLTSWPGQALALVAAIWFLNGLRKAILKPPVTYVGHTKVDHDTYFIEVMRQELLPPWRTVKERWRVKPYFRTWKWRADRELDGQEASPELTLRLNFLVQWALDREKELENLTKRSGGDFGSNGRTVAEILEEEKR